jgi:Hpt domain
VTAGGARPSLVGVDERNRAVSTDEPMYGWATKRPARGAMDEDTHPGGQVILPVEALEALREQFRVSSARTVAYFRSLSAELARTPTSEGVLELVRQELHRVRGTAGSYGFHEVSRVAATLEARVVEWAANAGVDRDARGAMIEEFAGVLVRELGISEA